ncbi:MAG: hypothetical protein M1831_003169 [Alyxoria varia]|nr:MAG: hypothetical protein M1831_003169 [Alyxoria varia]
MSETHTQDSTTPSNPTPPNPIPADSRPFFDKLAPHYSAAAPFLRDIARRSLAPYIHGAAEPRLHAPSAVFHDNACGPGIATAEVLSMLASNSEPKSKFNNDNNDKDEDADAESKLPTIYATDNSPGMITQLRVLITAGTPPFPASRPSNGNNDNDNHKASEKIHASVADSRDLSDVLPRDENAIITHSYTGFALPFFAESDRRAAAAEIYRTLRRGGVAVVTGWERLGWVDIIETVRREVDPQGQQYKGPNEATGGAGTAGEGGAQRLKDMMVEGGFEERKMEVQRVVVPYCVRDWGMEANKVFREVAEQWVFAGVGKEWDERKREEFREAHRRFVEREGERERQGGRIELEVRAWVAVARK